MINIDEVKKQLIDELALQEAFVSSNDGSHFEIIAVGELFAGMSRVKQQQAVYAPLMEYITSNQIHALSIKAYTPNEWQRERKLMGL